MKKIIAVLAMLMAGTMANAQVDVITKHSGEIVKGKVVKVEEYTIVYKYDGEDAENTLSKYAVEKIVVSTENDWEKVVILEDKAYIAGLKKGEELRGKTGLINYHTGNTADKKAEKKLKIAAAILGFPFVLQTADKTTTGHNSNQLGGSQAIKKGIGYKY